MKVTAYATRSGEWWAVRVPEIDGLFTQARRLDQVPEMVADAAMLLDGLEVEVEVVPQLDADDAALLDAHALDTDTELETHRVTGAPREVSW
jgi:hypothetical protein